MILRRLLAAATGLSLALSLLCCAVDAEDYSPPEAPELSSAKSAVIGDTEGRVLFDRDAYSRRAPASLTKIMTLLLAVEAIEAEEVSPDDMVTASSDCKTDLDDDSATVYIDEGETMSLEDLLYCAALASANEACNIIAEHVSGSVEAFVDAMNARAGELGCTGTHFTNCHGMPNDEHYTTARDLYVLCCEALSHPLLKTLVGTAEYTTAATNAYGERHLESSNALINRNSAYGDEYYYEGAIGIKTGRTDSAGLCLAAAAERNGVCVISVVLGAEGEEDSYGSFVDTITLLDWCFDCYSSRTLVSAGYVAAEQKVSIDGVTGTLPLACAEDISALAPVGLTADELEKAVTLSAETLTELPEAGTELGSVTFSDPDDGTVYGTVALISEGEVEYDEPSPTPLGEYTPDAEQQRATLIVFCIVAALALLLIVLLLRRASLRRRKKGGKHAKQAKSRTKKR